MTREQIIELVQSRKWFHRIELAPGVITPGSDDTPHKAELVQFPSDLTDKTVLDAGAYDADFSVFMLTFVLCMLTFVCSSK